MGALISYFNKSFKEKIDIPVEEDIKFINNMKENDINNLCLKIHILGSGEKKEFILKNMFKENVSDENLKNKFKVTRQFKTEQFHWIAHVYENEKLNEETCKEIETEIKEERKNKENEKLILKNQVILCFGDQYTELVSSYFTKFRKSNMIFITETECKLSKEMDRRYATNIIYKNQNNKEMSNEDLNIKIISLLWELDCYFKEKGNITCRYTPDNIFNGLENDNTLFTLNILVAGLARVGKSTFINLMSRKLTALESDLKVSVTKNISEYYIYNKENKKKEHGAIKLIDTPGLVSNNNNNDYMEKESQIKELIKNQGKSSFEKKIHFIFFILNKNTKLGFGDANNIKEVFKVLNESQCPVFFIVNKVKKTDDPDQIISKFTVSFNQYDFKNLSKKENFIMANFLKGKEGGDIHGINSIFSKILNYINDNKYLDEKIFSKIEDLAKDYRAIVEADKSFLLLTKEDILTNQELKMCIKFNQRLEEIKKAIINNKLLSGIDVDSLIENAKNSAKECIKVIISLSKLDGVLPSISQNFPAISIYQAFMVKEIGARFGLDIDIVNAGTKQLLKFIQKILPEIGKSQKSTKIEGLNEVDIEENKKFIQEKAEEKLKESTERTTILGLADILSRLKNMNDKYQKHDNIQFSISVYSYCIFFFEKEIKESEGLLFILNCFNKYRLLMDDIKAYIEKEEWDDYDIKIES